MNKRQNEVELGNLIPLDEESPMAQSSIEEEFNSAVPEKELSLSSRIKPNMGSRREEFQIRNKSLSKRLINLMEGKGRSTRSMPTESKFEHNDEDKKQNRKNKQPTQLQGLALSMRRHQKRQLRYRVANVLAAKESSYMQENRSTNAKGFWALLVKSLDQERVDTHR